MQAALRSKKRMDDSEQGIEEDVNDAEARMLRAMEEAEDEQGDSDQDEDEESKANYLPDHLFATAFASKPSNSASQKQQKKTKSRRKRSATGKARDIIVGSRTVRTLAHKDKSRASSAILPSAEVQKFLDRNLSRTRGWERRAANLGSLRQQGPAAHFVRST